MVASSALEGIQGLQPKRNKLADIGHANQEKVERVCLNIDNRLLKSCHSYSIRIFGSRLPPPHVWQVGAMPLVE